MTYSLCKDRVCAVNCPDTERNVLSTESSLEVASGIEIEDIRVLHTDTNVSM